MEGEKQSLQVYNESLHQLSFDMLDQEDSENTQKNENNGNVPNSNIISNKPDDNLDNEQLNLDVDNHNSRFESIYSQPIDTQDTKQNCNNGNIVVNAVESSLKQQELCVNNSGSSYTSSSSEDSPVNPSFRRSSKTLSFGKRKGSFLIFFKIIPFSNILDIFI